VLLHSLLQDPSDEFAGSGMRGVSLDDYGIARGEGGSRVAAGDRERQRKIAGAKDRDSSKGPQHRTDIRAGKWFALTVGFINAGIHPGTLFKNFSKESELRGGAAEFPLQTRQWQAALQVRAIDYVGTLRRKPIGDTAQQRSTLASTEASHSGERGFREAGGPINVLARGRVENRLKLSCICRVYCAKRSAFPSAGLISDK
jgi:hypothetical protein